MFQIKVVGFGRGQLMVKLIFEKKTIFQDYEDHRHFLNGII